MMVPTPTGGTAARTGPGPRAPGPMAAGPLLVGRLCGEFAAVARRILADWDTTATVRRALIAHAARLLHYRLMDWEPYWRLLDPDLEPRLPRRGLHCLHSGLDVDLLLLLSRQDAAPPPLVESADTLMATLVLRGTVRMRRCVLDGADRRRAVVRDDRRLDTWSVWVHEPGAPTGAVGFEAESGLGVVLAVLTHEIPRERHALLLPRGKRLPGPGGRLAVRPFRPRRAGATSDGSPTTALS